MPSDPRRLYPVCTGGKRPAPSEDCDGPWAYLEQLDAHRYPSIEAILTLADAAQVILEAPPGASIREAIGDLDAMREAVDRLDTYEQLQPGAFTRRSINTQLCLRTWAGGQES